MSNFQDREKAFESKYAHDEATRFKVESRRNKLLGLWLAEQLGKTGDDAEAYAKEVVISDLKEAGDEDIIGKVMEDISAANLDITRAQIEEYLIKYKVEAAEQLGLTDD